MKSWSLSWTDSLSRPGELSNDAEHCLTRGPGTKDERVKICNPFSRNYQKNNGRNLGSPQAK